MTFAPSCRRVEFQREFSLLETKFSQVYGQPHPLVFHLSAFSLPGGALSHERSLLPITCSAASSSRRADSYTANLGNGAGHETRPFGPSNVTFQGGLETAIRCSCRTQTKLAFNFSQRTA